MKTGTHFDKNNLHHAYLIEGKKEEIIPDVLEFLKSIGIATKGNPDFNQIVLDSFKIEDARNLKAQSTEKAISPDKRVFIISINNFLIEAQNALLKMFEEPTPNTIFFLIIPDRAIILPTLLSRFYLIKSKSNLESDLKEAESFLTMSLAGRINFVKEMIAQSDDTEEDSETIFKNPVRPKTIKFLNALETVLHQKLMSKTVFDTSTDYFYQIFKAREYLSQPGSSAKSLMESVALLIPKN
jgi:DNA polymerase III subunit delta'